MKSRIPDIFFLVEVFMLLIVLVASIVRLDIIFIAVTGTVICASLIWRIYRVLMPRPPVLQIGPEFIIFNDLVYTGTKEFRLNDVQEVIVVGPLSGRQIRIYTKSGSVEVVYRALRGNQLMRMVDFLRENLPSSIMFKEDEPPTWAATIRGDF
jgi:hypothetical protein